MPQQMQLLIDINIFIDSELNMFQNLFENVSFHSRFFLRSM